MKIPSHTSPLLLLLSSGLLSHTIALRADDTALTKPVEPLTTIHVNVPKPTSQSSTKSVALTKSVSPANAASPAGPNLGTKDAPVDGKDGKPHAGPFVDTDRKKTTSDVASDIKNKAGSLVDSAAGGLKSLSDVTKDLGNKVATQIGADGKAIPQKIDGIMNDETRQKPKEGTTGAEGGVSEKDKARKAKEGMTGEKVENTPTAPKEAPPLPHDEDKKLGISENADKEKEDAKKKDNEKGVVPGDTSELSGLEKPNDLPNKPNAKPNPLPNSAQKDHLDISKPKTPATGTTILEEEEGLIQPLHSYILSLTMILFSEIGDKTFLIAALMAMKHDRLLVFSAALSALVAMTVLSAVLGHAVPTLLPKRFTNFAAAILFLVFGAKMVKEGFAMSPNDGVGEEMREVEMELEEKEHLARKQNGGRKSSVSPYALEMGLGDKPVRSTRKSRSNSRLPSPPRSPSSSPDRGLSPHRSNLKSTLNGLTNLLSLLLSPAWVQTFVMTFLGEWGDRSQIATIAMAAGQDYWWVTGGAISGHAVCTGVAVIGGRAIAGKVSMRVVTLGGAGAFLIFGLIYLVEAVFYG